MHATISLPPVKSWLAVANSRNCQSGSAVADCAHAPAAVVDDFAVHADFSEERRDEGPIPGHLRGAAFPTMFIWTGLAVSGVSGAETG